MTLQKAGFQVKVYEARKDVGCRFHGDFQGIENWSQEEDILETLDKMGIAINFRCGPFYGGRIYGPTGEKLDLESKTPLFYLVRRGQVSDSRLIKVLKRKPSKPGLKSYLNIEKKQSKDGPSLPPGQKGQMPLQKA